MVKRLDDPPPPSEQIKHFTNRDGELAAFRRAVEGPTLPLPVLMFYGVAGVGKSWLSTRLEQQVPRDVPYTRLNLDNERYHTDSATALATIRRGFHAVDCLRFDAAHGWLRQKQGAGDDPAMRGSAIAGTVWEALFDGGQALASDIPGANIASWLANKLASPVWNRIKETAPVRWLQTRAGQEDWLGLKQMPADEILATLSERLLSDLQEQLPAHRHKRACRGVIFLDTYEALKLGLSGEAQIQHRNRWVRDLYAADSPVLLVITGRDRLQWERADDDFAQPAHLAQHELRGLTEDDARRFLSCCQVTDHAIQDAVLRVCPDESSSAAETVHHPFSLGLCADTLSVRRHRGLPIDAETFDLAPGDKHALALRFLKSLGDAGRETWIRRLALTPRYHEQAARQAFSQHQSAEQEAAWRELLDYSFVRPTGEEGWFTLHATMREALRPAADGEQEKREHEAWAEIWRACSQEPYDGAAALAWYHAWCIDETSALADWNRLAGDARKHGQMQRHFALLQWWAPTGVLTTVQSTSPSSIESALALNELGVELWNATVGDRTENLNNAIACYRAALRVRTEADFPQQWATTQNNLGVAYSELPSGDRAKNLGQAIDCYQAALRVRTEADFPQDWAMTQNNLGIAYSDLPSGDRAKNLGQAIDCYQAALRVYTEADFPQG